MIMGNSSTIPSSKISTELGIKNYYSSLAHPQSNGQAEVTIRTLKAALKTKLENLKESG